MERQQLLDDLNLPKILSSRWLVHQKYLRMFHEKLYIAINGTSEQSHDLSTSLSLDEARSLQRDLMLVLSEQHPASQADVDSAICIFGEARRQAVLNRISHVLGVLDRPAVSTSQVVPDELSGAEVTITYFDGTPGLAYTDPGAFDIDLDAIAEFMLDGTVEEK